MKRSIVTNVVQKGNGCQYYFISVFGHGSIVNESAIAPNCQETYQLHWIGKSVYWNEKNGILEWMEPVESANLLVKEDDFFDACDMLEEMERD